MQIETISLFEAIRQMRIMTANGQPFCFVFATYDRDRQSTKGTRVVKAAKLRPAAKQDDIRNADHKLFYFDEEIQENRNCWQVLIKYFEGKKIVL